MTAGQPPDAGRLDPAPLRVRSASVQPDDSLSSAQRIERGVTIVALRGGIDILSVDRLRAAVERGVEAGRPLVVDLSAVRSLDSTGLRALLDGRSAMIQRSAAFGVVCDAEGAISKILQVAGAGRFLDIYPTLEAALDAMAGPARG